MKVSVEQYAEAVLKLGMNDQDVEKFQQALLAFWKTYSTTPPLRTFLLNPTVSVSEKNTWLSEVLEKEVANFILEMAQNGDLKKMPHVARRIQELADEKAGVVRAVVTSAQKMSATTSHALQEKLEHTLKKKVRLEHVADENILGGVVIKIRDERIDASVATRLQHFRKSFTRH